jgi:hypothetical protein
MKNNRNKLTAAINLMMEDLHTIHPRIRFAAKEEDCECELDGIKEVLLEYLLEIKSVNNYSLDVTKELQDDLVAYSLFVKNDITSKK